MKVPFLDLARINAPYNLKVIAADVIDSGRYIFGPRVEQFEDEFARYLGVDHCIAVGSGLDTLRFILRAYIYMGVLKKGDEVLVPANTYIATILAITDNDLVPVFVEPDIDTFNLGPRSLRMTKRMRAVMVVHLYGRPCWGDWLEEFAKDNKLIIIEDNSQSCGASYGGRKTGALGDAAGTSLYPTKNLGALSDAGVVTTNDSVLADIVRSLGNYGKEEFVCFGYNSRTDEFQAAFLSEKLKDLDAKNRKRRDLAVYYRYNIDNCHILLPSDAEGHVYHLFVIRCGERDRLRKYLFDNGIGTDIHYETPPHRRPIFANLCLTLPVTEMIHNQVLSLPMSPAITMEEAKYVVDVINNYDVDIC